MDEEEYVFCVFPLLASIQIGIKSFLTADLGLQHLGNAQGFPQHLPPKGRGTGKDQGLHSVGQEVVCAQNRSYSLEGGFSSPTESKEVAEGGPWDTAGHIQLPLSSAN